MSTEQTPEAQGYEERRKRLEIAGVALDALDEEYPECVTRRFNALRDTYRNGRHWPEEMEDEDAVT